MILVSFIEPLFQLAGVPSAKQPAWANAYVGVHIYVFNALQLYVFKRYDFLSMYAFRLAVAYSPRRCANAGSTPVAFLIHRGRHRPGSSVPANSFRTAALEDPGAAR